MKRFNFLAFLVLLSFQMSAQAQSNSSTHQLRQASDPSTSFAFGGGISVAPPTRLAEVLDGCEPIEPLIRPRALGRFCHIAVGYEFGWLQPRFSNNVSVVAQQPTGNQAYAFDHAFEPSSRIWIGFENSRCNGMRTRYWYLDTDTPTQVTFATVGSSPLSLTIEGAGGNLSRTATANLGDAMTSDHHVEMRTIDIEGTHRYRFSRIEALGTFGLRYAKTHQRSHAVATDGTGALTELVCQDLDFEGFGPTVGAEMTRQLFVDRAFLCRFSCYANTRGSILFGTQEQEIVLVTGGGATLAEDAHVQDDFLSIAEVVGGLQFVAQPSGRVLWKIRTGYRAESWFGTGGPVDSDSNLGLHGMQLSIAAVW